MTKKIFILPLLLIAILLVFGCQQTSATDTTDPTTTITTTPAIGNKVGNLAPDFQLQDLEGNTIPLNDLMGGPVVINFWRTD
jgi:cytochrome oxidase Cu insertion factor (SCO1/SenC/PrrC family)